MANTSRPRRNLKSTLRLMAFLAVVLEGPQRAAAWLVVERLPAVALAAALASSVARLAGLPPEVLSAPALQEWPVVLVPALQGRSVVLVPAPQEWPVALVLEASVAQVQPRGQPDVLEARLVVA